MEGKSKAAIILALGKPKGAPEEEGEEDVKGKGTAALAAQVREAIESKDDEALASALTDFWMAVDDDG